MSAYRDRKMDKRYLATGATLLFALAVSAGGCNEDPPPDETPSFEEWVERYFAEDGMFCMMHKVCLPDWECEDTTASVLNDVSCESTFEPKFIDNCEAAYEEHLEAPMCDGNELTSLLQLCSQVTPCAVSN